MSRKFSNATLKFPKELADKVVDFLAANYRGQVQDLVHEAVEEHISIS